MFNLNIKSDVAKKYPYINGLRDSNSSMGMMGDGRSPSRSMSGRDVGMMSASRSPSRSMSAGSRNMGMMGDGRSDSDEIMDVMNGTSSSSDSYQTNKPVKAFCDMKLLYMVLAFSIVSMVVLMVTKPSCILTEVLDKKTGTYIMKINYFKFVVSSIVIGLILGVIVQCMICDTM
jgi:hypothetical protein